MGQQDLGGADGVVGNQNGEGLSKCMSSVTLCSIQNIPLLENSCSFSRQQSSHVGANLNEGQWFGTGVVAEVIRGPFQGPLWRSSILGGPSRGPRGGPCGGRSSETSRGHV